MYRLFIAVDIPVPVKQELCALRVEMPGARWVPPEQLHLTLRFIGPADEPMYTRIKEGLARVRAQAFLLELAGVGHFPKGRHPRVLWVGLEDIDALGRLALQIERVVRDAGCPPEERPFSPHITLARLKDVHQEQIAAFEGRHAAFWAPQFPVDRFCLYSSILNSSGAVHRLEAEYQLVGS